MLGNNGKLGFILFALCILLLIVAIVFCAVGSEKESAIVGILCCAGALIGCLFAFRSWRDPDMQEEKTSAFPFEGEQK